MGSVFRLFFSLAVLAAGMLLVAEIHARRWSPALADTEIGAALAESAAALSSASPSESLASPDRPPAARPRTNGTTPMGIAAALGVVVLTGLVLFRLS